MPSANELLLRLNQIGHSLSQTEHALALVALGSAGNEIDRLDDYSDLDFFVIVKEGYKQAFIQNLDWLERIYPIVYAFKNTDDGYKMMYKDEVFCEFAVFHPTELRNISFSTGRVIWKRDNFDDSVTVPKNQPKATLPPAVEWLIGEALTNLYVGLSRYHRGEKISALRFVENYAVDRILDLASTLETEQDIQRDPYSNERRFEQRFPNLANYLPKFLQGYNHILESAFEILCFLDEHFSINQAFKQKIEDLCKK